MKAYLFLFLSVGCSLVVKSQNDSANRQLQLREVEICTDKKEDASEAFNLYRSSKIASTEEILSRMEGVNLIRRGAFGMEPTLRAYSAGQINLTINGMKMYGACTDKMDPVSVYVEPVNLNKLQVSQGASGSMMGSTIGGGLNMQLKEAGFNCHNGMQAQVFTQFNSVSNGLYSGFIIDANSKKLGWRLNSIYRTADDYKAGGGVTVEHSAFKKLNINTSLAYKLTEQQLLIADLIVDFGRDMGYPALTMDVSEANAYIGSLTHRYTSDKTVVKSWENKVYYNSVDHKMDDTNRPETPVHMDMPGWSHTAGFYTQLAGQRKRHSFSVRVDGHQAYTKADMTMYFPDTKPMFMQTLPGNTLSNLGAALQYQYQVLASLCVGTSLRGDYYHQQVEDTFGILQWEGMGVDVNAPKTDLLKNAALFGEWKTGKFKQRLTGSYGERLPTANERIGFYLYNRLDGYDYLGNYALKPEQALQAEYKIALERKRFVASLTLFHHQIRQFIYAYQLSASEYYPMTIGARGVKTYTNIDWANVNGIEANYTWRFAEHWLYTGNERFTYANLSNGKPMQQVPPLKFVNSIRFQQMYWQAQVEHLWATQQERVNADFGEQQTPGWQILNLRGAYTFKYKLARIQLNAAVENVFDLKYHEHLDWGQIPRPGRNFQLGLNLYLN